VTEPPDVGSNTSSNTSSNADSNTDPNVGSEAGSKDSERDSAVSAVSAVSAGRGGQPEAAASRPASPFEPSIPPDPVRPRQAAVRAADGRAGEQAEKRAGEDGQTGADGPRASGFRWARGLTLFLLAALGFGAAVTVRVADPSTRLAHARPDELVAALDGLSADGGRLAAEATELERTRDALAEGVDGAGPRAALERDRARADALAVLAGTVPATGPGITLTIDDPLGTLEARMLLDALQELRGAGAEAIELAGVRVVASTYVVDRPGGGLSVDGVAVDPPYRLLAVGDAHTLAQAMRIPGGVLDTVATRNGVLAEISESDRIEILAVRAAPTPRHARPAG